jgi:hypothetical protein
MCQEESEIAVVRVLGAQSARFDRLIGTVAVSQCLRNYFLGFSTSGGVKCARFGIQAKTLIPIHYSGVDVVF